jgi:S1-C subfamily serine protease
MQKLKQITKGILLGAFVVSFGILMKGAVGRYKIYAAHATQEAVKNATVQIRACAYRSTCSGGTGFVYAQAQHGSFIITNKHVCEGAMLKPQDTQKHGEGIYTMTPVEVVKRGGSRTPGQIIKISQNADLCMIFTRAKFKNTLDLASGYKIGQSVSSYGFPQGGAVTLKGVIKDVKAFWLGIYSESDMKAWYGISGAAVVNDSGEVVGVMSNLLTHAKSEKEMKDRSKVYGSLFIPLEILQEFIGGN